MEVATRFVFGKELLEIAKTDDSFVVCNADTKACGIEMMGELFPDRSYSIGIAEQNLINVASRESHHPLLPAAQYEYQLQLH